MFLRAIRLVLARISDLLVAQNWDRALQIFFSGPNRFRLRGRILMAEGSDSAVDPTAPFLLKPLMLKEIAFDDDEDDYEDDDDFSIEQPYPRSGHRIVCIGNHSLFAFGGYNPELGEHRSLFGELWRFDLLRYRWSLALCPDDPGMPLELASTTLCTSGNYILIYGGSGLPFGHQNSNRLHICDTTQQPPKLQEVETTGEKPIEMYGQAMIMHEGSLYVCGGTTGYDFNCDLHRLDMHTRSWQLVGPSRPNERADPPGRYRHELAADKEHILVFGGGTTSETFALETIPAFHLPSQRWVELKTRPDPQTQEYPLPRKFHSIAQMPDFGPVFIAGGCNDTAAHRDIWRLDLDTRTWVKLSKCRLPYKLFFHDSAVTPDGCMFIFGGVRDRSSSLRTNNLYKLWVHVPPLKTIAAEAIRNWLRWSPAPEEDENRPATIFDRFHELPSQWRKQFL